MNGNGQQWIRKISLFLGSQLAPADLEDRLAGDPNASFNDRRWLDLSQLRICFNVVQSDVQTPNNATIRVYNPSRETVAKIRGEYSRVILQAGYQDAQYGVIFQGTIKQFRTGKENATDSFLDILAADGDRGYNFGFCNKTLAAGSSPADRVKAAREALGAGEGYTMKFTGGVLPRGKVLFGMARDVMRCEANSQGATWSVQDGKVQVIPLTGYLPGEAVVINAETGMVGIPQQTDQGMSVRCLLNPRLRIGGLIRLNNDSITQTFAQKDLSLPMGQIKFNEYRVEFPARPSTNGLYRLYVVEHSGDTRGQEWYSDLVCLAVDQSSGTVLADG